MTLHDLGMGLAFMFVVSASITMVIGAVGLGIKLAMRIMGDDM
jgi:hypothetical protein